MLHTLRQIMMTAIIAIGIAIPTIAFAQDVRPDFLGTNRDWNAFQFEENGGRVCYMVSRPTDEQGNYTRRGDVWVLITHRPAEGSRNVVHFLSGYPFADDGSVSVTVDGADSFTLFTDGEIAWSPDTQTDEAMVAAMRAGTEMVVQGRSARGTLTTDTYSLFGFSASLDAINSACGL
jgi:hypothetical protein